MLDPTPEQQAILGAADGIGNIQIDASAGTGKTSTLELLQRHIGGPILCLAFNKAIAKEMEKRFESTTSVRTFNGLGHRIWAQTCVAKLVLNTKKTAEAFKEEAKQFKGDDRDAIWESYHDVISTVGLAKNLGYVPGGKNSLIDRDLFYGGLEEPINANASGVVDRILSTSIRQAYAGIIDFDDQLYMPALFGGSFPKFPNVLVDEAQDQSPVNHVMLQKMRHSRIFVVGDPFQSIYQFRGACQGGMEKLAGIFSMTKKRLSVSFRCPEEIVANARWRVPDFKAIRAGGTVKVLRSQCLATLPNECAIICRNNAPLFRLALSLLSDGRACRMAGSDIGPRIIAILRRFGDASLPQRLVMSKIAEWRNKKDDESRSADDMAACLYLFAEKGRDLGQAIAYAEDILRQDGPIMLSTGHKSKGLEWDIVYHLDPWLLGPSEQDLNLRYVIQTRAKESYFEINSEGIE